ncbi:hypothetical protein [Aureliella helgolandensis]|uniref:Uncharacterized protein n=1 Tax=Aureliella helgolandensis TaxID=2527968 RepID=A0A518G8T1_9BACT|nr:hypothetical protein [Aureliella helgolandensis]QDV24983.1 hypothetical protein Q31a_33050 [Aureliella helgolandensis]
MNSSHPDSTPSDDNASAPDADTPQAAAKQVKNASAAEVKQMVTTIKNAESQVGEHIIAALQLEDTVAVLTSVVVGPGGEQHIVSAALSSSQASMVNQLLASASPERTDDVLCVGFHCLIQPKEAPK